MTDKTLGAYKRTTPDPDETTGEVLARLQAEMARLLDEADAELRDEADGGVAAALIEKEAEKQTGDDFARAEFARHVDGRIAMRSGPDLWKANVAGEQYNSWFGTNGDMARDGWAPVRGCPDPEQHDNETTHPGGLSASEWKILAESYGREMDRAREYAEETREFAVLWKETAREQVRRARTALSYASAVQVARSVASVTPCSCSAQRARAEKAEQERDEARADRNDALRREKAEQDRANKARRERDAAVDSALFSAESRPLTPDAITDEMVGRGYDALMSTTKIGVPFVRELLTAALTEPPARPEGAEEIEAILADLPDTMLPATDAGRADLLASRGVRVVGEDGAA